MMIKLLDMMIKMSRELTLYTGGAIVALLLDICILSILTRCLEFNWQMSSVISFLSGLTFLYFFNINYVFMVRNYIHERDKEFSLFLFTGLIGLFVTQVIMYFFIEGVVLPYEAAKLIAASISFFICFFLRKQFIFKDTENV